MRRATGGGVPVAALLVAALLATLLVAPAALACPVCGTPKNEATQQAFVGSTVFLSLLPLAMIGGLVGAAVWRMRRLEREAVAELPPPGHAPAGDGRAPGAPADRAAAG